MLANNYSKSWKIPKMYILKLIASVKFIKNSANQLEFFQAMAQPRVVLAQISVVTS